MLKSFFAACCLFRSGTSSMQHLQLKKSLNFKKDRTIPLILKTKMFKKKKLNKKVFAACSGTEQAAKSLNRFYLIYKTKK